MIKKLTLNNEQAQTLYILLSKAKLDAKKNKARYRFLQVIEDDVFDYEEKVEEINNSIPFGKPISSEDAESKKRKYKEATVAIKELSKQSKEYEFKDREVFAQVRAMFEMDCGQELEGRTGMLYEEIDQAFINVKETNDEN